jgi:hypothetical protein
VEPGVAAKALGDDDGSARAGGLGAAALGNDGSAWVQRPWRGGPERRRRFGELGAKALGSGGDGSTWVRRPWCGGPRQRRRRIGAGEAAAATRRGKVTCGVEALGCGGSSTHLEDGRRFDAPWPRAAHLDSGQLGNGDGNNLNSRESGVEHLGDDFCSGSTRPRRRARMHR